MPNFLDVDTRGVRRLASLIDQVTKQGERELKRAMVDTKRRSRTIVTRDIRETYAVKLSALNRNIEVSEVRNLQFRMQFKPNNINLADFGAPSQTKKGVRVRILKNGTRQFFPSAFIKVAQSGKRLVLRRARDDRDADIQQFRRPSRRSEYSKRFGRRLAGREEIKELFGPNLVQMVRTRNGVENLEGKITSFLRERLERRLDRLLRR